ncbi:MAG: hypothetical protein V8Q30_06585 [Acutalibacteraceae bacterium]
MRRRNPPAFEKKLQKLLGDKASDVLTDIAMLLGVVAAVGSSWCCPPCW